MEIIVKRLVTGRLKVNCYCVSNESKACVLIDPGDDCLQIKNYIESHGLSLRAIIHTHGHFDHIGASAEIRKTFNVPTYMHHADNKQLKYAALYNKTFSGQNKFIPPEIDYDIADIEHIKIDKFVLKVYETPGHTEGSVCFYLSGHLFTGDTLMRGCIGRTDLLGGNSKKLRNSLITLSLLQADTTLCPGHGDLTTLDHELSNNEKFKEVLSGL